MIKVVSWAQSSILLAIQKSVFFSTRPECISFALGLPDAESLPLSLLLKGIDNKLYRSPGMKMKLASSLKTRGYKTSTLRKVYISKPNGKKRPLGIPVLYDRSMQALYLLALAITNSYGFRLLRSIA